MELILMAIAIYHTDSNRQHEKNVQVFLINNHRSYSLRKYQS